MPNITKENKHLDDSEFSSLIMGLWKFWLSMCQQVRIHLALAVCCVYIAGCVERGKFSKTSKMINTVPNTFAQHIFHFVPQNCMQMTLQHHCYPFIRCIVVNETFIVNYKRKTFCFILHDVESFVLCICLLAGDIYLILYRYLWFFACWFRPSELFFVFFVPFALHRSSIFYVAHFHAHILPFVLLLQFIEVSICVMCWRLFCNSSFSTVCFIYYCLHIAYMVFIHVRWCQLLVFLLLPVFYCFPCEKLKPGESNRSK